MIDMRCIDCRHFFEVDASQPQQEYHRCQHPSLAFLSPVSGVIPVTRAAAEVRANSNLCGPDGAWFDEAAA
jgi:hypothetical protein